MIVIEKKLCLNKKHTTIFGVDFEWTKNYKIKNGNVPFCFSVVYFPLYDKNFDISKKLDFGFKSLYVESTKEGEKLIQRASVFFDNVKKHPNSMIIGHQLHSDLGVLSNYSFQKNHSIEEFKFLWKNRKSSHFLFDTRYDIDNINCKSRRLVDVCVDYGINVIQPEIKGSMSKMHNTFLLKKDRAIMERLSVMNLRHSLSTALLYTSFILDEKREIRTNDILYRNLKNYYNYVQSTDFKSLLLK